MAYAMHSNTGGGALTSKRNNGGNIRQNTYNFLRERARLNGYYGGNNQTPKTGGSGSGSGNGYNAYSALLAAYRGNDYSDYYNQMRAAAQAAYDRGMAALNNAYNQQMSSLRSNLDETKGMLTKNYNTSRGNINSDSEQSMKQAYINHMNSQRNLGQQMAAQGLSGGATETSMANMNNAYGNARNDIDLATNKNLSELEGTYNSSLSEAMQAYNSAVANANMQKAQQEIALENALASNQMSALSDYQSLMQAENQNYLELLKSAIAHGADFNFTPTQANNAVNGINYTQATMPLDSTNYAALQALMNAQQTPGGGAAVSLANPALNNNYLAEMIKQLYGAK